MIGSNEFFMQFFKNEDNIEIALAFICDPCLYPPTSNWMKYYPDLKTDKPNMNPKYYKLDITFPPLKSEIICAMMMRSYKMLQVLSNSKNFKTIYYGYNNFINIGSNQYY
jgi:hypothetical protein